MLACAIHQDDHPDLIRRIILASIRIQQEYHPFVRKSIILFHIHIKRLTATFIILVDQDDKTSIILVFNHKAAFFAGKRKPKLELPALEEDDEDLNMAEAPTLPQVSTTEPFDPSARNAKGKKAAFLIDDDELQISFKCN